MTEYKTLKEFYPYYLTEHNLGVSRSLHFIGTSLVIINLIAFIVSLSFKFLLMSVFFGYFFAWLGHFVFEKNRPATFKYPLKSLASDFIMFWEMLTFEIPFKGKLKE
ncbi:MAG: hypothetical protein ACJAT2_000823 [Bacteriovoracaceae bacterium]|jgi:hypothetical protein